LPYLRREFTPDFLFRVTEVAIEQLKTKLPRRGLFNRDLETLLTTRTSRSSARVTSPVTQETPDTSELALLEYERKNGGISERKLWKEILEHFKCNTEKMNSISLSTTAASTLAAASLNLEQHGKTTPSSRAQVVVFTCEHTFPAVHFTEMILPEFEQRMNELPKALPQFLEQLCRKYRQRNEVYPTSCPVCVYNFLREEQVKDKKFIIEGKLPQPWGI
jgi:hypothetical protein